MTDLLTGDGISSPQSDLLFLDKLQLTFVLETTRTVLRSKWMFCLRSFLAYTSDGNLSDESFEEPVTHLDLTVDAQVGA